MDYALQLRKSLLAYNELKEPDKAQQQAGAAAENPVRKQQEAAQQLLDFANKRKALQGQPQVGP